MPKHNLMVFWYHLPQVYQHVPPSAESFLTFKALAFLLLLQSRPNPASVPTLDSNPLPQARLA